MEGKRFLHSIRLQNILSFGPDTPELPLEPLNVLIGPNASGKSNLIEALSLLAAAPRRPASSRSAKAEESTNGSGKALSDSGRQRWT